MRGFNEQGTTTTPFDMVILNGMSRYHLAIEAIKRGTRPGMPIPLAALHALIAKAMDYSHTHLEDEPAIRDWTWST